MDAQLQGRDFCRFAKCERLPQAKAHKRRGVTPLFRIQRDADPSPAHQESGKEVHDTIS